MTNILQSSLLVNFLYPLLLMFFITFAVLEKTQIFGSGKKQINAFISLIVSLIFVGAVFPKIVVANLIQFMTIGLVIVFVALMLWGFVSGEGSFPESMKVPLGIIVGIAIFFAVLWATGLGSPLVLGIKNFFYFLFSSNWSSGFWTNAIFVLLIAVAVAAVIKYSATGSVAPGK